MTDDTKKIVRTRAEPQPDGATPAAEGKIVFHCSNGHRIVVKAAMAGQRGKCSKCGVSVHIPGAAAAAPAALQPTAPPPAPVSATEEPPAVDTGAEPAAAPEGPFMPAAEDEQAIGHAEPTVDMFAGLAGLGQDSGDSRTSGAEVGGFSTHGDEVLEANAGAEQDGAAFSSVPTAALVARLFEEMEHGGIIEIHINGGSVILPEFYESRWSRGSHGLFASRAADGTVTLTAVAWESIQKIVVRQVEGLPDGMFE
ncbi:MAG: hypothetical protein ACKOHK_06355 [Planctomycetia bacterium]